jgi:hypothetical protein
MEHIDEQVLQLQSELVSTNLVHFSPLVVLVYMLKAGIEVLSRLLVPTTVVCMLKGNLEVLSCELKEVSRSEEGSIHSTKNNTIFSGDEPLLGTKIFECRPSSILY